MTCGDFIGNLEGLNEGGVYSGSLWSSLLWHFLIVCGFVQVSCQGFLVREACVHVLVGGSGWEPLLSESRLVLVERRLLFPCRMCDSVIDTSLTCHSPASSASVNWLFSLLWSLRKP